MSRNIDLPDVQRCVDLLRQTITLAVYGYTPDIAWCIQRAQDNGHTWG